MLFTLMSFTFEEAVVTGVLAATMFGFFVWIVITVNGERE